MSAEAKAVVEAWFQAHAPTHVRRAFEDALASAYRVGAEEARAELLPAVKWIYENVQTPAIRAGALKYLVAPPPTPRDAP